MRIKTFFFALGCVLWCSGCVFIGNGTANRTKMQILPPECIEIRGDWHVEIICNAAEDSLESVIDENLRDYAQIKSGGKLKVSLPSRLNAMVLPTLKISLKNSFNELSLGNKSVCKVINFKSDKKLELEIEDNAVCSFVNLNAGNIQTELSDKSKLALKGKVKNLTAEVENRAVLEADEVENLTIEASDNAVCRIQKCVSADVEAQDSAVVIFKQVKEIRQKVKNNARIDYPVNIPEALKKGNSLKFKVLQK